MRRLEGKVALITGAASGMGCLAAEMFAFEGAWVAAVDRDAELLDAAFSTASHRDRIATQAADVTNAQQVSAAVDAAVQRWGTLDVLYNSAGICDLEDRSVVELDESIWDRTMAINVKGTALCCKYAIPHMRAAGGGSIINVASILAMLGSTEAQDAYSASKGAVVALTKSLAVQLGPDRIRANVIAPGPIQTALLNNLLEQDPHGRAKRLSRIPLGTLGQPEDVISLAVHLASDESRWTTGAVILVDGGITANYF